MEHRWWNLFPSHVRKLNSFMNLYNGSFIDFLGTNRNTPSSSRAIISLNYLTPRPLAIKILVKKLLTPWLTNGSKIRNRSLRSFRQQTSFPCWVATLFVPSALRAALHQFLPHLNIRDRKDFLNEHVRTIRSLSVFLVTEASWLGLTPRWNDRNLYCNRRRHNSTVCYPSM